MCGDSRNSPRRFTWQELSQLNQRHNAHVAVRGKVRATTSYAPAKCSQCVAIFHFQKRIVAAVRTLQVYDVSGFIEKHPGGARQLLLGAGKDITMLFEAYHHFNNSK